MSRLPLPDLWPGWVMRGHLFSSCFDRMMPLLLAKIYAQPFEMQVRLRLSRNQEFPCNWVGVGQACAFLQRPSHKRFYTTIHVMIRAASVEASVARRTLCRGAAAPVGVALKRFKGMTNDADETSVANAVLVDNPFMTKPCHRLVHCTAIT
eukprot:3152792-Pleurochrysis_carterae.AAC.1